MRVLTEHMFNTVKHEKAGKCGMKTAFTGLLQFLEVLKLFVFKLQFHKGYVVAQPFGSLS